ncbi:TPA: hypothetical protein ACGQ50_000814 [Enterobacter cloacae]
MFGTALESGFKVMLWLLGIGFVMGFSTACAAGYFAGHWVGMW